MDLHVLYDSDDDFIDLAVSLIPRPRFARIRSANFDHWSDTEFVNRFRFSKDGAQFILEKIRGCIASADQRGNPVSPEGKLLTALSFYASGSFMEMCGDRHALSKSSVCLIIHQVSHAIASIAPQYISLPVTEEDKRETRRKFHSGGRFPSCLGALDCTHVKISPPDTFKTIHILDRTNTYVYLFGYFRSFGFNEICIYCRWRRCRNVSKQERRINVQTVYDADPKITNIVARWPGSAHDATILRHSRHWHHLSTLGQDVILADSGYDCTKNLITKLRNPSMPAEQLFNESQIRTRNIVERSYGVWKRRFPILANGIRVKLERTEVIIVATAVLHNIAIMLKEQLPAVDMETANAVDETIFNNISERDMEEEGRADHRRRFITYFNSIRRHDTYQ